MRRRNNAVSQSRLEIIFRAIRMSFTVTLY